MVQILYIMYVNGKMRPGESIPGRGREGKGERWRG
jgi:hypothetical protein